MDMGKEVNFIEVSNHLKKRIRDEPYTENFEDEKKWLINQMLNTIETGESTSALIVDVTKSSTTRIIEDAVSDIKSKLDENFTIIKLYGRLHSEADNAFHEIVESLSVDCPPNMEITGFMADKVDFVLKCIRDESENKPVIFILDEFNLFCDEGENTLIYPIIDVLHSKVPICIIGVTSDQTCIQRLGKRVTSRFSGKIIYLESKNILERNMGAFHSLLSLEKSHFPKEFVELWNLNVRRLSEDPLVENLIEFISEKRFSEEEFRDILFFIVSFLDVKKDLLSSEDVIDGIQNFLPPDYPQVFESLSAVELCLIVAIQHHMHILNEPIFNFKAIFHRYNKLKLRSNKITQMSEHQGKKAFETLISLGIIKPLQSGSSELLEYIPCRFRPLNSAVKHFIINSNNVPDFLKQWLKNSLIYE